MNVVYKLALGCITDGFKIVLDKMINQDQTGFIKDVGSCYQLL